MNKSIILILILTTVNSCKSQKMDLEKIELGQSIGKILNSDSNPEEQYFMLARKTGFKTSSLENYKFGGIELKEESEYRMSESTVGDLYKSFAYFLYENGGDKDQLSSVVLELKNTELSQELLDYLFQSYGEPKIIGNPLSDADEDGIIVDYIYYNWENSENSGLSYFVSVTYSKVNKKDQSIEVDLIIYDSSDKEYQKLLESNM